MKLFDNLMNSFPPPPLPLTSPTSLSVNWQPIFYGLLYTLLVKIDSPSVPPDVNVIPSLVSNLRGKRVSLDIIIGADEWKNHGKKEGNICLCVTD